MIRWLKNIRRLPPFLWLSLLLCCSGCACHQFYLPEMELSYPQDRNLTCQDLDYKINESYFLLINAGQRIKHPIVYSDYAFCALSVKRNALLNRDVLTTRIDYLQQLKILQGCDIANKILKEDTERVESRIDPTALKVPLIAAATGLSK